MRSEAVIEARGAKPRQVYQPLRVAITGATVSPGIFESVALLGRERDAWTDGRGPFPRLSWRGPAPRLNRSAVGCRYGSIRGNQPGHDPATPKEGT